MNSQENMINTPHSEAELLAVILFTSFGHIAESLHPYLSDFSLIIAITIGIRTLFGKYILEVLKKYKDIFKK